ncbi:unnamed protein product [Paramecium octaurelia]|uniref:Uncharacterized protein n=1 Tax=Paramecium octaurelia TaxID=43137 RepID=A0A8S1X6Z7_PAROT|nr:unnamed protein product [Paramecium octaurelia]
MKEIGKCQKQQRITKEIEQFKSLQEMDGDFLYFEDCNKFIFNLLFIEIRTRQSADFRELSNKLVICEVVLREDAQLTRIQALKGVRQWNIAIIMVAELIDKREDERFLELKSNFI